MFGLSREEVIDLVIEKTEESFNRCLMNAKYGCSDSDIVTKYRLDEVKGNLISFRHSISGIQNYLSSTPEYILAIQQRLKILEDNLIPKCETCGHIIEEINSDNREVK